MALNERKLTKSELDKREDIVLKMKKNKRDLVKKYGKDAEAVMYGRATNMAKKATKEARDPKITELIKDALKNPKKADLNKDGKLSDYEKTRGAAIEKSMDKDKVDELIAPMMAAAIAARKKKKGEDKKDEKLPPNYNYYTGRFDEDLDLGHEDNEPHMLKGDLYRIGKYAMELYQMVDQFEGMGEVDFPSWWQSKIFKAKEALVGAKHYLDFELKEPQIDAVVDVATDVVDETVEDYVTSVDDLSETNITEGMNYDKWRRAYNGKAFASKVTYIEDSMGNKKRYVIYFRYKETPTADVISLNERLIGGHEGSGMNFALSNMQNKPERLFTPDDKMEFGSDEEFERFLEEGPKGLENLLTNFLGGKFVDDAIEDWLDTGVIRKNIRVSEAKYFNPINEAMAVFSSKEDEDKYIEKMVAKTLAKEKAAKKKNVKELEYKAPKDTDKDDIKIDPDTEFVVNLKHLIQKHIKEGLPKGFFDKKMKAKDEKVNEDYDSLVGKLKKRGKSEKAAKAIAGAVASYKAKGGGKGPTAKQKST